MPLYKSRPFRIVAIWLAIAGFTATQNVLVVLSRRQPIDWQWSVFHEFVYWLTWAAFTPLVLAAASRWPLESGAGFRALGPHLLTMAALAPVQITTCYTLHFAILSLAGLAPAGGIAAWYGHIRPGIVWGTFTGMLYYWLILGVRAAFVYQQMYHAQRLTAAEHAARAATLEGQLAQAQLATLRLQLHPHFLFNTLNAIAALTGADPPRAHRMLGRLGDLLRMSLESDGAGEISLERELQMLAPYLEIQLIRFGDRLQIEEQVDSACRSALVPTFLLQPLVENAVQHGVSRRPGPARIGLSARRNDGRLELEVVDDGPGPAASPPAERIGLANTRARLLQLYGSEQSLELRPARGGGAVVRVAIPYRDAR
jgi:hypothetical protein